MNQLAESQDVVSSLNEYLAEATRELGSRSPARDPGHYHPWHWPLHPVSTEYHIPTSAFTETGTVEIAARPVEIAIARTASGVFCRCDHYRAEARGETLESAQKALITSIRPLLTRKALIAALTGIESPGTPGRYSGPMRDLPPDALVKLFFASDRSVAHDACHEIEASEHRRLFTDAFRRILDERAHPYRRTAQWLVLDQFEELPYYCADAECEQAVIQSIFDLMWEDADDDYGRTIYKAGIVLGGHVLTDFSAERLMALLEAPSKIARRSAMHAVFHTAEWMPNLRDVLVDRLKTIAPNEPEPQLRDFALAMARDIAAEETDHIMEPVFADED